MSACMPGIELVGRDGLSPLPQDRMARRWPPVRTVTADLLAGRDVESGRVGDLPASR